MRASIHLLLPLIVAASQLPGVHPADGGKRNLKTEETRKTKSESRLVEEIEGRLVEEDRSALLDFFEPIDCVCVEPLRDITIADYVCAEENERVTSLYCRTIRSIDRMLNLLNNTLSLEGYYDLDVVPPSPAESFGVEQRPAGRSRFLQSASRNDESLTAFVYDDNAMRELGRRTAKQMYDPNDKEVELYFKGIGKNISNDDLLFEEFFFGPAGRIVREEVIANGIAIGRLDFDDLECGQEVDTINGRTINTSCSSSGRRRLHEQGDSLSGSKFIGGAGNTPGEEPRITDSNKFLLNGVAHVLNGVIEPELGTDLLINNVNFLIREGIFDKQVLVDLEELTGLVFEETYPPTISPSISPSTSTEPSRSPTRRPTRSPTRRPTRSPTRRPTRRPTRSPTRRPTIFPTTEPTTFSPTTSSPPPFPIFGPGPGPSFVSTPFPTSGPTPGFFNPAFVSTPFPTSGPTPN
jgi:hypothetical protein